MVLSFYLPGRSNAASCGRLRALAQLALPLLRTRTGDVSPTGVLFARVMRGLAASHPTLTERERQVCAARLTGFTAEAIALRLSIAVTSVRTDRRRAHDRLGISNVNQLLSSLIACRREASPPFF